MGRRVEKPKSEKEKYEKAWEQKSYRSFSPGLNALVSLDVPGYFREMGVKSILDAGCGAGGVMKWFDMNCRDEFSVHGFDIAENCLDQYFAGREMEFLTVGCIWDEKDLPAQRDAVFCADVLEHIPPQHIDRTLANLRKAARKAAFLSIALFDDVAGPAYFGEPLHLTVRPVDWWIARIRHAGMKVTWAGTSNTKADKPQWLHVKAVPLETAVERETFTIDWGIHGLLRLLSSYEFRSVLDIGSGASEHARLLRHCGKEVVTVDLNRNADIVGDFVQVDFGRTFDVIWCCHVLEHQRNVGQFLDKVYATLDERGILAVSVPTHPPERMVAGHVSAWNPWLLCYNLVLSGFDCREASFSSRQDLSLIVRKNAATAGDIGTPAGSGQDLDPAKGADPFALIAAYFPFDVGQGAVIQGSECCWGGTEYKLPSGMPPFRLAGRFLPPEGLLFGFPAGVL